MIVRLLFPCVGILLLSGCHLSLGPSIEGSGNVVTHYRPVDSFQELSINGSGEYEVSVGQETSVAIEVDDNIQEHITTVVHGDRLDIGARGRFHTDHGIKGDIYTPELSELTVTGSGDVNVRQVLAPEFLVAVTGSGDVYGEGNAQTVHIHVTGSGDVDLSGIVAQSAKVTITGSGDVKVFALESLDVTIVGSGSLEYIGTPAITKSVTGSGDIQQIGIAE